MMKKFLSTIAILMLSFVAACAQTPTNCKGVTAGMDACGACPCRGEMAASEETGKMCDHSAGKQHCKKCKHGKHMKKHKRTKAAAKAPVAPAASVAPSAAKAPAVAPTIPAAAEKGNSMLDGVKKMIQDVKKP